MHTHTRTHPLIVTLSSVLYLWGHSLTYCQVSYSHNYNATFTQTFPEHVFWSQYWQMHTLMYLNTSFENILTFQNILFEEVQPGQNGIIFQNTSFQEVWTGKMFTFFKYVMWGSQEWQWHCCNLQKVIIWQNVHPFQNTYHIVQTHQNILTFQKCSHSPGISKINAHEHTQTTHTHHEVKEFTFNASSE